MFSNTAIVMHVTLGVRVTMVFFFVVVVVCVRHADGDDSCHHCIKRMTFDSCAGWHNVAVCVCHARIAAIDILAAIFVIAV
jgi:hypothetical protein